MQNICPLPPLWAAPSHWKPFPDPQILVSLAPSLGWHGSRASILGDIRPARTCVTVGPKGRPGLQSASPQMGAEAWTHLAAATISCPASCLLTFKEPSWLLKWGRGPGCLCSRRLCGSWVSSWQAKMKCPRLSLHNTPAQLALLPRTAR